MPVPNVLHVHGSEIIDPNESETHEAHVLFIDCEYKCTYREDRHSYNASICIMLPSSAKHFHIFHLTRTVILWDISRHYCRDCTRNEMETQRG